LRGGRNLPAKTGLKTKKDKQLGAILFYLSLIIILLQRLPILNNDHLYNVIAPLVQWVVNHEGFHHYLQILVPTQWSAIGPPS